MILAASFPQTVFNSEIYEGVLGDLGDEDFKFAISNLVRELREIYPGTNLVAHIRDLAEESSRRRMNSVDKKLQDLRSDPAPKEWEELKQKLGL